MTLMTPNPNSFQFKKFQNLQLLPIVSSQKHFDIGPWCVYRDPRHKPIPPSSVE